MADGDGAFEIIAVFAERIEVHGHAMRNLPSKSRKHPLAESRPLWQLRDPMKLLTPITLMLSSLAVFAGSPAKDREAILAMAGTYNVTFEFRETAAIAPDYKLKTKPYTETASEVVVAVEDTPERITLQHLLVVSEKDGKAHVIKHWAQIWTWQDTELLDYCGAEDDHLWRKIKLTHEEAAGTWSQLVTSVDDTPRYEGYGKRVHDDGESHWQSNPTRRPLPRREYTTRDDYDYLTVINRHALTPSGWIHCQDNRKILDREGEQKRVLCYETGLNTYTRSDSTSTEIALTWWKENGKFWDAVRSFWILSGEKARESFTYTTHQDGEALNKRLSRLAESKSEAGEVTSALNHYVIAR